MGSSTLFASIIAGVLSVVVWETLRWAIKGINNYRIYHKYNGTYEAYPKHIDERNYAKIGPTKIYKIIVVGSRFKLSGTGNVTAEVFDISGEVKLDGRYGKGYYQHLHIDGSRARFGFIELQLAGKDILAHEIIFDANPNSKNSHDRSEIHSDGYRWVRRGGGYFFSK